MVPDILYQYKPLNIYAVDQIVNNYFWAADPGSFNDPFDANILQGYVKKGYIGDKNNKAQPFNIQGFFKKVRKNCSISSFSKVNDNNVMWAHYADRSNGVCIGYETKGVGNLYEVIYVEENFNRKKYFEELGRESNLRSFLIYAARIKSKEWEYEREWRYINYMEDTSKETVRRISMKIKSIYLGYKLDQNRINLVRKLIQGSTIKLYHMGLPEQGCKFMPKELN